MSNFSRITGISLKNFKNVEYGRIADLEFSEESPSILGLYGQNGSGKTAVVEACQLLKCVMSGLRIPDRFVHAIGYGKEYAELVFSFVLRVKDKKQAEKPYVVVHGEYAFKITGQEKISLDDNESREQVKIFDEVIKISCKANAKFLRQNVLIDTSQKNPYAPLYLFKDRDLRNRSPHIDEELSNIKYLAQNSAVSAIFNDRVMAVLFKVDNYFFKSVLNALKLYALTGLCVVTTKDQNILDFGLMSMSIGLLKKRLDNGEEINAAVGTMILPLLSKVQIPLEQAKIIEQAVASLNNVLESLIPGLSVQLCEKNVSTDAKGQEVCNIEVYSLRKSVKVPLEFESNGIKKLISILQLIIAVYNRSDITAVIDELDAGIFEYLLGDLLSVIAEKGKGQFFFTSHNLRPLELLDKKYLCFTSVNPTNRYVRAKGIKSNNNIRDLYIRELQLGGQKDPLYESTDKSRIAFNLYKAGHADPI